MVEETVAKDILDKLNAGIEITGTDVDIRDLTHVSDSVEAYSHKAGNLAWGTITVDTNATQIISSQSTRTAFIIVNNSSQIIYIGGSTVTVANGIPLEPGASYENQVWTGAFYGIVAAGDANVRYEQFYTV